MVKTKLLAILIALFMLAPLTNSFASSACKKDYKAAKAECKKMEDKSARKKCTKDAREKYKACKKSNSSGGYGGGY